MAPTVLSLFTGIGGLDLGLQRVIDARLLGCVELDSFAASVLLERMENADLDPAPVFVGDIADVSGCELPVDIVTASCPCQPFSLAGKGDGIDDERHLWPDAFRIIQETDCSVVFLEQVASGVRSWLPDVLTDLAEIGFDAEWTCVTAQEVGAPHKRERLFVLAHRDIDRLEVLRSSGLRHDQPSRRHDADRRGAVVVDAHRPRLEERLVESRRQAKFPAPWPPGPADREGWERWIEAGGPEPVVRRGVDGFPARVDRLRALGNAVVPQQAEHALRILMERA